MTYSYVDDLENANNHLRKKIGLLKEKIKELEAAKPVTCGECNEYRPDQSCALNGYNYNPNWFCPYAERKK